MHCDHFVSSENLLNQNVSVCQKSVIDLVEVKWRVKIQNFSKPNFAPDENLSKRSYVQEQLTIGNLTNFFCPYIILLCHILILHI